MFSKCLNMPADWAFITPCPEIIPNFMSDAICHSLLNKIIEVLEAKIFKTLKVFFKVIIIWFLLTITMTITFTVHKYIKIRKN